MSEPTLEIIPLRGAVKSDAVTELDVLVRIVPAQVAATTQTRPQINLGLVLDRSGSMSGRKIENAHSAAIFAVQQLMPTDRVSVTIFDEQVETIVHNVPVTDKRGIIQKIEQVQARGTTALHAAWAEGATQVAGNKLAGGLNRVLLLSDGLANEGLTDPIAIAAQVHARREQGVSTSTLGVGDDYNELLMQKMAQTGDGNYYFVDSPTQLADLFQTELHGLMATVGKSVKLGLEAQHGAEIADVLNDLEVIEPGQWRLSNLIAGMPVSIVVHLRVPPLQGVTELLRVRLAWDEPRGTEHQQLAKALILPAVSTAEWDQLPIDPNVREHEVALKSARLKLQAAESLSRGDVFTTVDRLTACENLLMAAPQTATTTEEMGTLSQLQRDLAAGMHAKMAKRARFQHYSRGQSRPNTDAENPSGSADTST